ncbi:3-oxoacyl-[acyl-carrier protein] reductase [Labilithrix luteola]|uniref:3-oxoacyl-[acyl-carrier protein] reductase n=1 Tax=Labilithrix luteola TaxID=1391654 RepID=A0A0K1PXN3_9BACT|nr:SDR family NAD(P)-dependent oxidoreductase [Labilithrix luteola]AKU97904.1 3-oxoacyl-[acyl-carrier protein] reductase [Labilithrix luteola]
MSSKSLEGRVAVVTGAAQGIDRAIATKLASHGAELVLVDQRISTETAEAIGRPSLSLTVDVSRDDGWAELAADVEKTYGRVDIVINNAAYYPHAGLEELSLDVWQRTLDVNLTRVLLERQAPRPVDAAEAVGYPTGRAVKFRLTRHAVQASPFEASAWSAAARAPWGCSLTERRHGD